MAPTLESRIRERAYEIWTAHGRIDGQADRHWLEAEREILATAASSLPRACARPKTTKRRATSTKAVKTASRTYRDRKAAADLEPLPTGSHRS